MSKTGLIYHPIFLQHDTGLHHPERPARVEAILKKIKKTGIIDRLKIIEPKISSIEDVMLVHPREYVLDIKERCRGDYVNLDTDTIVSKDSFESALFAVGSVITAIDLVCSKEIDNGFCMVRPPGHHARISQAMGFCIFNNVAIGARYLQHKYSLKRIVIIDWDAHHGNGTEEIFYEEPSVFYISLHQYPHYPGTGSEKDIGKGEGKGYNLNIPMQSGSGDNEYLKAFQDVIIPKLKDYKPEFILISAGFDGHRDDPLSSLNLTETGYCEMTKSIKNIAHLYSENRIVSVLEGGYNLSALGNSVGSHLHTLN